MNLENYKLLEKERNRLKKKAKNKIFMYKIFVLFSSIVVSFMIYKIITYWAWDIVEPYAWLGSTFFSIFLFVISFVFTKELNIFKYLEKKELKIYNNYVKKENFDENKYIELNDKLYKEKR